MNLDFAIIFESSLKAICKERGKTNINWPWRQKYFILLRLFGNPELRLYSRKPKNLMEKPNERISIENGYHIFKKLSQKGKSFICHMVLREKEVYLASSKGHVCEFIYFFMMTLSRLKPNPGGCQAFVVRPEKSEDSQRIGCVNSICMLVLSRWGITLTLQISGNVLGHWPLRCIKSYECSGQGCFVFEAGHFAPSGSTRLALKTKFGQDDVIYNLLDELVEETATLESVTMDRLNDSLSKERIQQRAFLEELNGLSSISEVSCDQSFDHHLKKLSRDIYDHLESHFGESERSAPTLPVREFKRSMMNSHVSEQTSLTLSEPPTSWHKQLSVTSDNVFQSEEVVSPPKNKYGNYIDMTREGEYRNVSSFSHIDSYLLPHKTSNSTEKEKCLRSTRCCKTSIKPQVSDFGCYIQPNKSGKETDLIKDNYLLAPIDQNLNDNPVKTCTDLTDIDKSDETGLYCKALETQIDSFSMLNNSVVENQCLDRIIEPGDEIYLSNKCIPLKKNLTEIENKSRRSFEAKLAALKLDFKKPFGRKKTDAKTALPLVQM